MSYYLDRLKKLEKRLLKEPAKPTKAPFDPFAGNPSRRISEKTAPELDLYRELYAEPETPAVEVHALPVVFEYQLSDRPGAWLVLVARPGTDLDRARRRLAHQFGADRVLEVREHSR